MVFEEWAAFQTGIYLAIIFAIIIIVYFKLRERVSNIEKILKSYRRKDDSEQIEEKEPKEI